MDSGGLFHLDSASLRATRLIAQLSREPIMSRSEIESLVDAVNARYADRERRQAIRAQGSGRPRFELYHFFMSMCSYKLRTVLDEKQLAYVSHDIDIFPPDIMNYYPEYVRLRLRGGEALTDRFVRGYTGLHRRKPRASTRAWYQRSSTTRRAG